MMIVCEHDYDIIKREKYLDTYKCIICGDILYDDLDRFYNEEF